MKNKYESEILQACHESAKDLFEIGVIDSAKMKEFDEMCLTPAVKPVPKTKPATPERAHPATA
jgi:putative transcriptional regulator